MPTYEYRCVDCHETFERPEHIEDHLAPNRTAPQCPRCGSTDVEPLLSASFVKTRRKS